MNRIGPTCFISSSSEIAFSYEQADQETTLAASEEFENRRKALASALAVLNARERRIFEARRLAEEPITLNELADEFGVSRERVRQISVCAFEKVQKSVKNCVTVRETPAPGRARLSNPAPRPPAAIPYNGSGRCNAGRSYGIGHCY